MLRRPILAALGVLVPLLAGVAIWAYWFRPVEPPGILPFPSSAQDYYMLDDVAGHLHRPNVERTYSWDEHPTGRIVSRTNNLGFREDEPTAVEKAPGQFRILVTGDSHIDGVVYNAESFSNVLEASLSGAPDGNSIEVLNGGVGHYGPANYPGFLEKHLSLSPDLYIVVLYTGNDYLDAIRAAVLRGQLNVPARPPGYVRTLERASKIAPGAVDQSLNQLYFFKTFPDMRERAVEITREHLGRVRSLCARSGTGLLIVALPSKVDVEYAADDRVDAAVRELGLSDEDLRSGRRMTEELLGRLAAEGVATLDPVAALRAAPGPLFWREDHHLNVAGHRALAGAALPLVAEIRRARAG